MFSQLKGLVTVLQVKIEFLSYEYAIDDKVKNRDNFFVKENRNELEKIYIKITKNQHLHDVLYTNCAINFY